MPLGAAWTRAFAHRTVLHDFLVALFERAVVTSTQCELIFAGLTRLTRSCDEGIGLPSLTARYVINAFTQQVQRWRENQQMKTNPLDSNRCRPPWLFSTADGVRTNHLHLLCHKQKKYMSSDEAKSVYDTLPVQEQEQLRNEARLKRDIGKMQPSRLEHALRVTDELVEGPLDLAARQDEPFPLRPSVLRQALETRNVDSLAAEWREAHESHVASLASFPATVRVPDVCQDGCNRDFLVLDEDGSHGGMLKPEVDRLLRHLQLACRFANVTKRDQSLLLRLDSHGSNAMSEFVLITHHSREKDSRFEATCVSMEPLGVAASGEGTIVHPASQETPVGLWPCIETERRLLRRLFSVSDRWDISQAITRRAAIPLGRLITGFVPLSYEDLVEKEAEANMQARALRALRMVMGNASRAAAAKSRASGRGRRRKQRKGKEVLASGPDVKSAESGEAVDTESSGRDEDPEVKKYWSDIMNSILKPKLATATASSEGPASASGEGLVVATASGDGVAASGEGGGHDRIVTPSVRRKGRAREYLPAIGNGVLHFEQYDGGATGKPYENWILKCPHHTNCERTRGCGVFATKRHAELEPLAFLHAWRDVDVPPGKKHRLCNPTTEQLDAQMAENAAAFADLNAKFRE